MPNTAHHSTSDDTHNANGYRFSRYHDDNGNLAGIIVQTPQHYSTTFAGVKVCAFRSEHEAIKEATALAQAIQYKASLAALAVDGGCALLFRPDGEHERIAMMESLGQHINLLNGQLVLTLDSGAYSADMDAIHRHTDYVTCTSIKQGGIGSSAPYTTAGIISGMQAALMHTTGSQALKDVQVAVQGVGSIGYHLVQSLVEAGAHVTITDRRKAYINRCLSEFPVEAVTPEQIYNVNCDIFSPCGSGGVINAETLPLLSHKIIAGSATHQLATQTICEELDAHNITYVPDFAINSGGLINAWMHYDGINSLEIRHRVACIYETTYHLLRQAAINQAPTHVIAEKIVKERLAQRKVQY